MIGPIIVVHISNEQKGLPADLRLVDNYARFRRLLKGHMFG